MSRSFSVVLDCGCLIAENDTDGWSGICSCYAEYGDMSKKKDKDALKLHDKCMKEYFDEKKKKI